MIYGFLFSFLTVIVYLDIYSFGFYLVFGIILGILDSVYQVAYQSFYPEMISEGNFSKAYSISSLIYPIANTIMVPIAGFAYEYVGVLHYKYKYPTKLKFKIAVMVYCTVSAIDGALLFMGYPAMLVFYLFYGTLSVTSYNIRTSGTQSYVDSEKRGRFNGLFMMITTAGQMTGQLVAGVMGEFVYIPYILVGFNILNFLAALFVMIPNKKQVSLIYNQQL